VRTRVPGSAELPCNQWTKIWKFGAGLGHLYAGDYLKESKYGFGYTYPYLMFSGTF
jgi:hypothetical protein